MLVVQLRGLLRHETLDEAHATEAVVHDRIVALVRFFEKLPRIALDELQAPRFIEVIFLEKSIYEEVSARNRRDDRVYFNACHVCLRMMRNQVLGIRIPAAAQNQHVTHGNPGEEHAVIITRVGIGKIAVRVIIEIGGRLHGTRHVHHTHQTILALDREDTARPRHRVKLDEDLPLTPISANENDGHDRDNSHDHQSASTYEPDRIHARMIAHGEIPWAAWSHSSHSRTIDCHVLFGPR